MSFRPPFKDRYDAAKLQDIKITATGAGLAFDTANYNTVAFQLSHVVGTFSLKIEGCNEESEWGTLCVLPLADPNGALVASMAAAGNYFLEATTRLIRYNVTALSSGGSVDFHCVGRMTS